MSIVLPRNLLPVVINYTLDNSIVAVVIAVVVDVVVVFVANSNIFCFGSLSGDTAWIDTQICDTNHNFFSHS